MCEGVKSALETCLCFDREIFVETCKARTRVALSINGLEEVTASSGGDSGPMSLPSDVLLKLVALSILPSYCLRLQGEGVGWWSHIRAP